jgi:hypothetical protein
MFDLGDEQDAQKMEFVLQKEKQEAERKRVEARGIADYQTIIALSLTLLTGNCNMKALRHKKNLLPRNSKLFLHICSLRSLTGCGKADRT